MPAIAMASGSSQNSTLDKYTGSTVSIPIEHNMTHRGKRFFHENTVTISGAGNVYQYVIVTPATTTYAHLHPDINGTVEYTVDITEGIATVSDGTAITAYNKNRNSATTATTTLFHTPDTPSGGTVISSARTGSGKSYGGAIGEEEIVMKANTKYMITITQIPAGDGYYSVHLDWYELSE